MSARAPWFAFLRRKHRRRVFDTMAELDAASSSPSRGWPITERLMREVLSKHGGEGRE